jgi:hypothetical protein
VSGAHGCRLVGRRELPGRVLADRFEQAVARSGHDQRFVDQARESVHHGVTAADRLGGVQGEAAGEDRQATQQRPLRLGEQVVRPVERGRQRLLARRTPAAREQAEGLGGQPGRDLAHLQREESVDARASRRMAEPAVVGTPRWL